MPESALEILGYLLVAAVLPPCLVLTVETLAALLPRRSRVESPGPRPSTAVLVPAHDEEAVIAGTLTRIRDQLGDGDRLLVVADNCSDRTAEIAVGLGAEVIRREDAERVGKGFALAHGFRHLQSAPPEVVVVIDADSSVGESAIDTLARQAGATNRPAQAIYLFEPSPERSRRQVVSTLAITVKNRVRPLGLDRLGVPCLLTGTGMAFPWPAIDIASFETGNIVEDMKVGIDLTLAGQPPMLCPAAQILGVLPGTVGASTTQRRRWEHGHLRTLLSRGPALLLGGLRRGRLGCVALGLDLLVPPLALLTLAVTVALGVGLAAGLAGGGWLPGILSIAVAAMLVLSVLAAWLGFCRDRVKLTDLLAIPAYVLWKIPIYVGFLVRRERRWRRTPR